MAELINAQTNVPEEVPQDSVQQALSSGSHNLAKGSPVNVINPQGELVSLPAEQVQSATTQGGFKFPTQEQVSEYTNQQKFGEGVGNEAKAAVAGAARGASFGLSDEALTQTGLVDPNTLKQLRDRNPIASTGGELAGVGASLLVPGLTEARVAGEGVAEGAGQVAAHAGLSPVQAVAVAGKGVSEGIAPTLTRAASALANPETSPVVAKILASMAKTGAKAAGSAVEGAVYGLGNAVTEHALGDADFNSENILHNVGYGALFGGALGGALGLGESVFSKEIEKAALKDSVIENAANVPDSAVDTSIPSTFSDLQKKISQGKSSGLSTELPAKKTLLDAQQVLAGDSEFPVNNVQIQSLERSDLRDIYKTHLESGSEEGNLLREYEAIQKQEGTKLTQKFVDDIAPQSKLTSDAVEGGDSAKQAFIDSYKKQQAELKPVLNQIDEMGASSLQNPHELLQKIEEAIPESSQYITKTPEGIRSLAPYEPTMGFSKEAHSAMQNIIDAFNKPEISIGKIRNLRESLRDSVNYLSAPRAATEINGLRKGLMDIIQQRVEELSPDLNVREVFKKYAINEQERSIMERIFGGSISDKASFQKTIKSEDVLSKIFSNTESIKAAKAILGEKFDEVAGNYLSHQIGKFTDSAKNGFSSNKFATFLKTKGPELEEALAQHPEQLKKLQAITDKMRILPDSPSVNPSGTAKTSNILAKIQGMSGYLTPSGILSAPGALLRNIAGKVEQSAARSELERVLAGGKSSGEQLLSKQKQYSAFTKIERMGQQTMSSIKSGTSAIFSKAGDVIDATKGIAAQHLTPEQRQSQFEKLSKKLVELNTNPQNMIDALHTNTQSLHEIAPEITSSLHMAATRATQFLASKLPAQEASSPLSPPYKPSGAELAVFNRYVQAVNNPVILLKQIRSGNLTKEALEAVGVVHPKTLAQMRNEVMGHLTKTKELNLPYQTKLMLSMFTGSDLHNSLKPFNIQAAQANTKQVKQGQSSNTPTPVTGAKSITRSNQVLTPFQSTTRK